MSMDPQVARRRVEILNALGLHLRPAAKFTDIARAFRSRIVIHHNGEEIDGTSILSLSTLAAEQGTVLELEARGPDAEEAVAALAALVEARFHEDESGEPVGPGS